ARARREHSVHVGVTNRGGAVNAYEEVVPLAVVDQGSRAGHINILRAVIQIPLPTARFVTWSQNPAGVDVGVGRGANERQITLQVAVGHFGPQADAEARCGVELEGGGRARSVRSQ